MEEELTDEEEVADEQTEWRGMPNVNTYDDFVPSH